MSDGALPSARVSGGLGLTQLRGGESAPWELRVADADLDLDDAITPDAGAHGEGELSEDELQMGDLEPLGRERDLAVGGECRRLKTLAECRFGLGGWNDD